MKNEELQHYEQKYKEKLLEPVELPQLDKNRLEWTPLRKGGNSYKTHKLVPKEEGRLEYKSGPRIILIGIMLVFIGLFSTLVGTAVALDTSFLSVILPMLGGSLFTYTGALLLYQNARPIVFDKKAGFFCKGRVKEHLFFRYFHNPNQTEAIQLKDIVGIQVLKEIVNAKEQTFKSYEFNLILKDGSRVNVIDHGVKDMVRVDAYLIAEFLDVPIIDGLVERISKY